MPAAPKILALSGSTRKGSYNQLMVNVAAKGASEAGAEVTVVELQDYDLPLFNQDLEADQGLPERGKALRQLFTEADGFLLASPEYNGSFTAVLKNAIDWISRPQDDGLSAFKGKTAALMSTSPGGLGGLRALPHVRYVLSSLGVLVIPDQIALPAAYAAFDETGNIVDADMQTAVKSLGEKVAFISASLKATA